MKPRTLFQSLSLSRSLDSDWIHGGGGHERERIYGNARRNRCVSGASAHKQRSINLEGRMPNILPSIRTADTSIGS